MANKKRLNEIAAKKAELKIKNEAFDMKRPNVPSLGDEHAAIKKPKPKAMGK